MTTPQNTDEQLARALQAQEEHMASHNQDQAQFAAVINGSVQKVLQCEDPLAQALALSLMPLDQITAAARESVALNVELGLSGQQASLGEEELVVQGLLAWFKRSFFTWTNAPPCSFCGCPTSSIGMGGPTAEEAADLANRVELYRCGTCRTVTRFPRYTNAAKLLETRHGRCGEWAHCFLLCLRAAGIEARHCQDWEDHVWCEFYSARFGRWVHLDSCEGAFDMPLLYERGWGKKLSYVVAVGRHGAVDITRRYVLDYTATASRRRRVDERWLLQHLGAMSAHMRRGLQPAVLRQLQLRDLTEQMQLLAAGQLGGSGAEAGGHLPGRQTGSEAWRTARGETGANAQAAAPSAAEPEPAEQGTLYRRAGDAKLPALFGAAGRVTGGACRASGEHEGAQQSVERLFDGCTATKWLDFGGGGASGRAWVEYRLLDAQPPVAVTHYDLVSGEDCPEMDPMEWTLECIPCSNSGNSNHNSSSNNQNSSSGGGSRDGRSRSDGSGGAGAATDVSIGSGSGGANGSGNSGGSGTASSSGQWQVLDKRAGEAFTARNQLRSFQVAAPVSSRRYRLCISRAANPGAANSIQLSCWNLYAQQPRQQQQQQQKHEQQQQHEQHQQQQQQQHQHHIADSISSGNTLSGAFQQLQAAHSVGALLRKSLTLLKRIITNLVQQPEKPKFRQLRTCKVQSLLEVPAVAAILWAIGFRPLLVPAIAASGAAPGVGGGSEDEERELVLVVEHNACNAASAKRAQDVVDGLSNGP